MVGVHSNHRQFWISRMSKTLSFEEYCEQNPVSIPAEFEEQCASLGLDPKEEMLNIQHSYYEFYLEGLEYDR